MSLATDNVATAESETQAVPNSIADDDSKSSELTYFRTLLYAGLVGAAGGVVATIYYFVLEQLLELVWETGRESIVGFFPAWLPHWQYTWMVATVGGLGVGLCLYFLGRKHRWYKSTAAWAAGFLKS